MALGGVGVLVAIALVFGGYTILTADEPSASQSPTRSASARPSRAGEPERTGTVEPSVDPPNVVACGGDAPPDAGQAKPQFSNPPGAKTLDEAVEYTATMNTSCGSIRLSLDATASPKTVASFVFLARLGFFDGLTFHRIVPGFVIQGGDPLGSGNGGPGYSIPDEYTGSDHYSVGVLAMANANDPDAGITNTGGSQFFIVSGPRGATLDDTPNYTVFGRVVQGLDAVKRIDGVPVGGPAGDTPQQAVYIESVTISERPTPSPSAGPDSVSPSD